MSLKIEMVKLFLMLMNCLKIWRIKEAILLMQKIAYFYNKL
jgi:hypothetical protein